MIRSLSMGMLALALWCLATQAQAVETSDLARHMLSLSGRSANPKGVCVVPAGGDLALKLTQVSGFYVVSQEPTAEEMKLAAAEAEKHGLLGTRMTVVLAPSDTCVVADCYANLYVLTRVSDEQLRNLSVRQIVRKLAPRGGRAIVGLAAGEKGTLSLPKFEAWAKAAPGASAQIVQDRAGTWAIIEREALPGAAQWSHRFFDAANNPVSTDTAFRWPPATQWLEKPYHDGGSLSLMANGRVFIFFSGYGSKAARIPNNPETRNIILARDAYNGRELWKRQFDPSAGLERRMSPAVATGNSLWVIPPKQARLMDIAAESGKDRRGIDLSAHGDEAKWLGIENGIAVVLVGPQDNRQSSGDQWRWFNRQYGNTDPYQLDLGRRLVGIDLATGKVLWHHEEPSACIHETSNAIRSGRVYTLARGRRLLCLDLRTGRPLWENVPSAAAWDELAEKRGTASFGHHGGLLVGDGTGIVYIPNVGALGFDTTNGKTLWKYRGAWHPVIRGDRVFTASGAMGLKADEQYANTVFDLKTGQIDEKSKGVVPVGSACGSISQSPLFHYGSWGITYDFARNLSLGGKSYNDHRNNCDAVGVFAEGLLFAQAYECTCNYKTRGQVMDIAAPDLPRRQTENPSQRLWIATRTPASEKDSSADWPTCRANIDRSAACAATVSKAGRLLWTATPAHFTNPPNNLRSIEAACEPCAPVIAGDRVFVGRPDGAVHAVDLTTGKMLWTYYTSGRIYVAPTYWRGRLYLGSGDGYVYCLDAASGTLVWRFGAAPTERRIFAYGHLVSTWPVTTGVVIHEGNALFAAALLNNNGSFVYCLDATSGKLIWQNDSAGIVDDESLTGVTAVGVPTVAAGKLWIRQFAFDLKDGSTTAKRESGMYCRYTGRWNDQVVLIGGWRFDGDWSELQLMKPRGVFTPGISAIGTSGQHAAILADKVTGFAAWDDRHMVALPFGGNHTVKVPKVGVKSVADEMVCWTHRAVDDRIGGEFAKDARRVGNLERPEGGKANVLRQTLWRIEQDRFFACALASNAVLATYGEYDQPPAPLGNSDPAARPIPPGDRWFVAAFDRADGRKLWQVPLPSLPLVDGIAIAHNGVIIVQMLDGSVIACK